MNYDKILGKILIFAASLAARDSHVIKHWTMRFESQSIGGLLGNGLFPP